MFEIIPLELETEDYISLISKRKAIEKNSSYITSIKFLGMLLKQDNYPIKNKNIAIENILSFMSHIDMVAKYTEGTLITVRSVDCDKYFTKQHRKAYMDFLKDNNILTKVPYSDGKYWDFYDPSSDNKNTPRPMQYRIHNEYLNDDMCIVVFSKDSKLKLDKDNTYNKKFEDTILKTDINYRAAIIAEIDNFKLNNNIFEKKNFYSLRNRISAILRLSNKRYIKKGKKVDRIYHSFSNLSRISRKYLNIKSKSFYNLDIVNCQPLLLAYHIKSVNGLVDDNYIKACEDGVFYESLMDDKILEELKELGDIEYEIRYQAYRDSIKLHTYKSIYFSFKRKRAIALKFKEMYPQTYEYLDTYYKTRKKEDPTMASILQNVEACVFNSLIPSRSKYYFTLFDAIYYINYEDTFEIQSKIKEMFSMLGITPKIK